MYELIFLYPLFLVIAGAAAAFTWSPAGCSARAWVLYAALAVGAFFLPLCAGVWIPDIFSGARTVGSATTSSGYSFLVTQELGSDFYATRLFVTSPSGTVTEPYYVDGDDSKSWKIPVVVDEAKRSVTLTLSGGRVKAFDW